jgi:hypothetical protein
MSYVSLGRDSSSLRPDGTFAKDDHFDKRDPKQGRPLTWAEIRERMKNERETDD